MALDVDRLRTGLDEYRRALARQRERLRDAHGAIQHRFDALWSVYGGQMAEDLKLRWARTSEWLETYAATTDRLDRFLQERIDHLRSL